MTRPTGLRRPIRPHLGRDIAAMLAFKLIALIALYFLFFGPASRPHVDLAHLFAPIAPPALPTTTR